MEMLHILRNGRQKIQGGQPLETENTAPGTQINLTTGTARPVSRREAAPNRPSSSAQPRNPRQPRP